MGVSLFVCGFFYARFRYPYESIWSERMACKLYKFLRYFQKKFKVFSNRCKVLCWLLSLGGFFLHVHVLCIEIFNIVLIKWMPYDFPKLQWRLYTGNIIRYVSLHILIKYEVMLPCVTIWMLIFETCETRGIKRSTHMYDYFVILLLKLNIIKICSTIFFTAWSALRGA